MDITEDLTALIRDNASRKSFGRRVSFASSSHVRLISGNKRRSSIRFQESSPEDKNVSNENDYPGQGSRRRRSSVRQSLPGSEDMDLTTVISNGVDGGGSAILDEEFDYDEEDYGGDDMEVTQAIHGEIRKRSVSTGGRQALADLSQEHEANESRSDAANSSYVSESASEMSDLSQLMEFTVPLGQSLRPAEQDEAWLALKQMTHSGEDPNPSGPDPSSDDEEQEIAEDMNLEDAMARLRHARDSLAPLQIDEFYEAEDDTFSSAENSFNDSGDDNRTMNLSQVLGRASLGGDSRLSLGQESNMDESEVYGYVVASTPQQSTAPEPPATENLDVPSHQAPPPTVFQPPQQPVNEVERLPEALRPRKSVSFSLVPQGPSNSNTNPRASIASSLAKARPSFSAAFAPPIVRPSPKRPTPVTDPRVTPTKRPRPSENSENVDQGTPSPAKRQALAGRWLDAAEKASEQHTPSSLAKVTSSKPRPLSPNKKSPFQPPPTTSATSSETSKPSSALRRPSGYFAKRKSLAVGFTPTAETSSSNTTDAQKKSGIAHGRRSMGSAPSGAWTEFDKETGSGINNIKEKEAERCVREAIRQGTASPTPNRGSPSPTKIPPSKVSVFERPPSREPSPSPLPQSVPGLEPLLEEPDNLAEQPVEYEEMGQLSGNIEVDMDATQQWREGIQQPEEEEEEVVSNFLCPIPSLC